MSLFTHLPAELIRTILDILDPTSFYLCLQTSKLFRKHAAASTKLLKDQLSRIPGQRILPAHMAYTANDADALIRLFSTRAMQHLACGTEWMSDRKVWSTGADRKVHRKASQLVLWGSTVMSNKIIILLEVMGDATVNVYIASDGEKEMAHNDKGKKEKNSLEGEFVPRLKHAVSTHGLSKHLPECKVHGGQYEVVKVTLCPYTSLSGATGTENGNLMLGVLYKMKVSSWECECKEMKMKLLVFRLDRSFGPIVVESFEIVEEKYGIVVAMGLISSTEALLVMTHHQRDIYRFMTYKIEEDENRLERHTTTSCRAILPTGSNPQERVASLYISRSTVHLYPTTFPMPHWTITPILIRTPIEARAIERRDTVLPDTIDIFLKHSLGRPIAWRHYHDHLTDLNNPRTTCVNIALELAISNEDCITGSRKGAFLLRAKDYPVHCEQFQPEKDHPMLHHEFVAQLAGLPALDNLSTLGLIVAVSRRAYRIAIASWRTLKVWSLDPHALLDPEYPPDEAEGVPDDHGFVRNDEWTYYNPEPIYRNCVTLCPVELPSSAVIFALEFRGEDELWGWTEAGLCRWNFGPGAKGRRVEGLLEGV